jgi:hypothetical protein
MSKFFKYIAIFSFIICLFGWPSVVSSQECGPNPSLKQGKKKIVTPKRYQLLFFRHDGRVWIILPQKTSLLEIYSTNGLTQGWVAALNVWRQPLAMDTAFDGEATVSSVVQKACFPDKIVTTIQDKRAVGIYTPKNASYIEIINAKNGFDGVVSVLDKNKKVIARQTGLDIQVINYK